MQRYRAYAVIAMTAFAALPVIGLAQPHDAVAMAGLGGVYRQSQLYAVEVDADRDAALVRGGYAGPNTAIVAEMLKACGGCSIPNLFV